MLLLNLPLSAICLCWAGEPAPVKFQDLKPEHRVEGQHYFARATYQGQLTEGLAIVIESAEPGAFHSPVFVRRGGAVGCVEADGQALPEVVETRERGLFIKLGKARPPILPATVGSKPASDLNAEIKTLFASAGVAETTEFLQLETDNDRRRLLVQLNLLALCRDEDVSLSLPVPLLPKEPPQDERAFIEKLIEDLQRQGVEGQSRRIAAMGKRYLQKLLSRDQLIEELKELLVRHELFRAKEEHGLSVSTSSSEPMESLMDKLHKARLIRRVLNIHPEADTRELARLEVRALRDHLNVVTCNLRVRECGLAAQFETEALPAAILRSVAADSGYDQLLATPGRAAGLSEEECETCLKLLGLDHGLDRARSSRKREVLQEAMTWRALVHALRMEHLSHEKIVEHVSTRQAGRVEALEKKLLAAEPNHPNAREVAQQTIVNSILKQQREYAYRGIPFQSLDAFYKPFPRTGELAEAYGFLGPQQLEELRGQLLALGLKGEAVAELAIADAVQLLSTAAEILKADSLEALQQALPEGRLARLGQAMSGADTPLSPGQIWPAFHQFEIELRYEFKAPEGPDRNASWLSPETLGHLADSLKDDMSVEIRGSVAPANGDCVDWWYLPDGATPRQWHFQSQPEGIAALTEVSAEDGRYFKVTSTDSRPAAYTIISTAAKETRRIRRTEQREFHQDLQGPPY